MEQRDGTEGVHHRAAGLEHRIGTQDWNTGLEHRDGTEGVPIEQQDWNTGTEDVSSVSVHFSLLIFSQVLTKVLVMLFRYAVLYKSFRHHGLL